MPSIIKEFLTDIEWVENTLNIANDKYIKDKYGYKIEKEVLENYLEANKGFRNLIY